MNPHRGNALVGFIVVVGLVWGASALFSEDEPTSSPTPSYTAPSSGFREFNSGSETYSDPTYHTDTDYQYNYRTGYSGSYEYNYDVSGSSYGGDSVYGEIETEGKYGEGYIYDDEGNEIYVETEWVGYGEIEATDEDGNTYELEVD